LNLSERKKKILSAVVDESIKTAEPVGSKALQEKYIQDVSSATIRNELMALEEMGYLYQPHTSAGRVPTQEGYKKYVEELMTIKKLSKNEADLIKAAFSESLINLDDVLQKAAKAISDATNYTSMVYYGLSDSAKVENIALVKLNDKKTLVVVVTDIGILKKEAPISSSEEELKKASIILTNTFKGYNLEDIELNTNLLRERLIEYKEIFDCIINIITTRDDDIENNIAVSGKEKLLDYPEYHNIDKLRKTMEILEQKESLYPLLSNGNSDLEISVKVGGDESLGLTDCSIITASYKSKGKTIGTAGIVGPMRMDYSKIVSILKNITQALGEEFDKE